MYDGKDLDQMQVNTMPSRLVPTESGNQAFILMPPPDDFERLMTGAVTKIEDGAPRQTYKRVAVPGGTEYHLVSDDAIAEAIASRRNPLSDEAQKRKEAFARLADQFTEQLRCTDLEQVEDVLLVTEGVYRQGNPFISARGRSWGLSARPFRGIERPQRRRGRRRC